MDSKKLFITRVLLFILLCMSTPASAETGYELKLLQTAYPAMITGATSEHITWKDGSKSEVPRREFYPEIDRFLNFVSLPTLTNKGLSIKDFPCDNSEPFFKKMYGETPTAVQNKLVTIYWMTKVFGKLYPLKVTTVNGVDKKLQRISAKLEKLPSSYFKYLAKPSGTYYWRKVAGQDYLSTHSFGIAMDLNSHYGSYWLWDRKKTKKPFARLVSNNKIPMVIVRIFEQEGFFWGGRRLFYDTMHFEYRPEFFVGHNRIGLHYGLLC